MNDVVAPLAHSDLVGGSTAARLLACPGSYKIIKKIPDRTEVPSVYAQKGHDLHEAIAVCIIDGVKPSTLVGQKYGNSIITIEDLLLLAPIATYCDLILDAETEFLVEQQVVFPGIPGAFGTCDLFTRWREWAKLYDWKFGAGVGVDIVDEEGFPNGQLMFYAAAFRNTFPDLFDGVENIELVIFQPALSDTPQTVTVTPADLDAFVLDMQDAVREALGPNPLLKRGKHCKFCPAKPVCPQWTGPLLNLEKLMDLKERRDEPDYGEQLSRAMAIADIAEEWAQMVRSQAHAYLANGGLVPGFKLVPKRGTRHWLDESAAIADLVKLGLPRDILALRSPAQVEAIAKVHGLKVPKELWHSVSSGTTLAPADDPRPERPTMGGALEAFRASVKLLSGGNENAE